MNIEIMDGELVEQIHQLATQEQRAPEQVIAEALHVYQAHKATRSNSFLRAIAGLGRSGQHDVAERAEDILAAEIDEQRGFDLGGHASHA